MLLGGGEGIFWGDNGAGWIERPWIKTDAAARVYCLDSGELTHGLGLVDGFGEDEEVKDKDD